MRSVLSLLGSCELSLWNECETACIHGLGWGQKKARLESARARSGAMAVAHGLCFFLNVSANVLVLAFALGAAADYAIAAATATCTAVATGSATATGAATGTAAAGYFYCYCHDYWYSCLFQLRPLHRQLVLAWLRC